MYEFLRVFFTIIFSLLFRWKTYGIENIPSGGVIIAANHISLWDPPIIGTALPGRTYFMAKEELFTNKIFGRIIANLGAFPVKRGAADRTAIKTALTLLQTGNKVGIFPEGTRSKNGILGNPEAGLALIAVKAGVPVVPTAIIGTNKVFSNGCLFPKFKVIFGKPLVFNRDKESMEAMSARVMTEISHLLAEADTKK